MNRIFAALKVADEAHADQRYGDLHYIVHPVEVAMTMMAMGGTEDEIAACLLHDVPEDTKVSLVEVGAWFGPEVGAMVAGMTNFEDDDYPAYFEKLPDISKGVKFVDSFRNYQNLSSADMPEVKKEKLTERYLRNISALYPFVCMAHYVLSADMHEVGTLALATYPNGWTADAA